MLAFWVVRRRMVSENTWKYIGRRVAIYQKFVQKNNKPGARIEDRRIGAS